MRIQQSFVATITVAAAFLTGLVSPASAQSCPNQIRQIVLADFSYFVRKVAFSPNGNFLAFTTRAGGGAVLELRVAPVSAFSVGTQTSVATLTNPLLAWNDEIDFVWAPNSTTIYFTAPPQAGSPTDRTSFRSVSFSGSSWGAPQVLFEPGAGFSMQGTRLAVGTATEIYGTWTNSSGTSFIAHFPIPVSPPSSLINFTWTTVPNTQLRCFTGATSPSVLLLCSERNTVTNTTQYFTLDGSLASRANVGGPLTQTADDITFATFAPAAAAGALCVSLGNQVALHGGAFSQVPITSGSSPMLTSRAPRSEGNVIAFMAEEGGVFSPAIIPPLGGGVVVLATGEFWTGATPPFVAPSVNPANSWVAYSFLGALYAVRTDREVVAFDRATSTGSFQITLPCGAGEAGGVYMSTGPAVPPGPVSGFCGTLGIDLPNAVNMLTAVNAPATTGPLALSPAFLGMTLHIQGFRLTATQNELTRLNRLFVF